MPVTRLTWAPGLCGAPDVSTSRPVSQTAVDGATDGNLGNGGLSTILLDNGHEVVVIEETTHFTNNGGKQQVLDNGGVTKSTVSVDKAEEMTKKSMREPVRVTFRMAGDKILDNKTSGSNSGKVDLVWESLLWRGDLFLNIPDGIVVERSKEAFISLLEFGEEHLRCNSIVVCFSKSRPERNVLMRMFMFLGFVTLAPNHPMVPANADEDTLYMAYAINN